VHQVLLGCLILACGPLAGAEEVPQVRFTVKEFIVEGDNPLPEGKTKKVLDLFLGEHEGLSRIEEASGALEDTLREEGYAFYRVVLPPQRTEEGVIRLKVMAFPLDRVTVKGNKYFSKENILASLPTLKPGLSPNTLGVARSLLVANEHPAKRIAVFIRNSAKPGHIDARVETREMRPLQVFASLANTGSMDTGHTRFSLGCQHSNLFKRDHIATLSYTTSPGHWNDVQQYGVHYRIPIYKLGAGVALFYSHSKVDQGRVADFFQVSGKGTFAGISFDYAFLPMGDYSHKLSLGFQDRLFENDTDFSGAPIGVDVRSRPITFRYSGRVEKAKGQFDFYAEYGINLPCGGQNDAAAYAANRAGADKQWDVLRFGADFDWTLPREWRVRTLLSVQLSDEPLISGEQFGLGGVRSIRGFEEREVSGESGFQLNAELWTPPLPYNFRLLGFVDFGRRYLEDPHPGLPDQDSLMSVGMGVRWQWKQNIHVALDYGQVLHGTDDITRSGDEKLHFNVFFRY
jgi:hemolysin activation/secretion protein